jgi:hypothetical protein
MLRTRFSNLIKVEGKGKGKVVPVHHAMKLMRGRGIAPLLSTSIEHLSIMRKYIANTNMELKDDKFMYHNICAFMSVNTLQMTDLFHNSQIYPIINDRDSILDSCRVRKWGEGRRDR